MKAITWQVFPSNSKEKPKNTRYSGDYRSCESNQTKNYCTYVKKHNKKVLSVYSFSHLRKNFVCLVIFPYSELKGIIMYGTYDNFAIEENQLGTYAEM